MSAMDHIAEHSADEHETALGALEQCINDSGAPATAAGPHPLAQAHHAAQQGGYLHRILPRIQQAEARRHLGNYVVTDRASGHKTWESMPLYVRLGMHALFVSSNKWHLTSTKRVEDLLRAHSIKEGEIFDQEEGAYARILGFVKTYQLEESLAELLLPDLVDYRTFNDFFSRRLRPDARPVAAPDDPDVVVSAADCRLTVFASVDEAKKFWVKGSHFDLKTLFQDERLSSHAAFANGAALAIFRLAPQDYHRWHSPVACKMGAVKHIPGQYYTVNPQAINEDFDVFTENKRDVVLLQGKDDARDVAMVAVGAMLVGSIGWTVKDGDDVAKGAETGWFAYGGSTVICAFASTMHFDDDLLKYSAAGNETLIKVGQRIGAYSA